jgi:hypothetical protein
LTFPPIRLLNDEILSRRKIPDMQCSRIIAGINCA